MVKFDVEQGDPVRDEQGFCIRCAPQEVGEAIGPILNDASNIGGRFEGYTSREASEKKILRNVFKPGDAWVRTGDLMRKGRARLFLFRRPHRRYVPLEGRERFHFRSIRGASAHFPESRKRMFTAWPSQAPMAGPAWRLWSSTSELDLAALRAHLVSVVPHYARPLFLRIRNEMEVTATFKYTKTDLVRQGYDPAATSDPPSISTDAEQGRVYPARKRCYDRIQSGLWHPDAAIR